MRWRVYPRGQSQISAGVRKSTSLQWVKWIGYSIASVICEIGFEFKAGMNPGFWWILDGLYLKKYWSK